jgi:hypothetical protein
MAFSVPVNSNSRDATGCTNIVVTNVDKKIIGTRNEEGLIAIMAVFLVFDGMVSKNCPFLLCLKFLF